jgi:pilus assembly protein Flp/PilA
LPTDSFTRDLLKFQAQGLLKECVMPDMPRSALKFGSTPRQSGQGMVEYALILVLVSIVVIVILLTMGQQISNVFSNIVTALGA